MSKRPGANKENLEETRNTFLKIARKEFSSRGFAQASTSRIVEQSGMARGSLYYHFGDKNGLFQAVYEQMMDEALISISVEMDKFEDPWDSFMTGSFKFLDLCMEDDFRKIVLIESQAAMSFQDRLMIQERTLLAKLRALLPALLERGYFPGHTSNSIVIFVYGILGEIGRAFDFSEDIQRDRQTYGHAFETSMNCMTRN